MVIECCASAIFRQFNFVARLTTRKSKAIINEKVIFLYVLSSHPVSPVSDTSTFQSRRNCRQHCLGASSPNGFCCFVSIDYIGRPQHDNLIFLDRQQMFVACPSLSMRAVRRGFGCVTTDWKHDNDDVLSFFFFCLNISSRKTHINEIHKMV